MTQVAGLCNNAKLYERNDTWEMIGDPTEGALLTFVAKSGFDAEGLAERFKRIKELPFDSERKRMTVIVEEIATKKLFALVKGAPETV